MTRPPLFRGRGPGRAPVQARSRESRDAILEAARVRFARDGYERTSIRAIARVAGVATGALYQFFPSKRDLLLVSMDALLRHLESVDPPAFRGAATFRADLARFLEEVFERERPYIGVYRGWRDATLVDRTIARHDARIRAWTSWRIARLFTLFGKLPGARADLDVATLAELWDRFFWDLLASPPSSEPRAIAEIAAMLAHTFVEDGVSSSPLSRP